MVSLKERYNNEIIEKMMKKFGYKNKLQVPRIEKVVINAGVGRAVQDPKVLDIVEERLALITGQKPVKTYAKKSIAGFKLREGMPIGLKVTLRSKMMYDFINRLVNVSIPRIRDFRGIKPNAFDGRGSYSLGIKEYTIFPETAVQDQGVSFSLQINVVTTAKKEEEARELLKLFGFPFKKEN